MNDAVFLSIGAAKDAATPADDATSSHWQATELARGPWHPQAQHGGAPAALLAWLVSREDSEQWALNRLDIDLLRPVPVAALTAEVRVTSGRAVRRASASLRHGDIEVARATATLTRQVHLPLPAHPSIDGPTDPSAPIRLRGPFGRPLPPPEACLQPLRLPGVADQRSFHYTAIEARMALGDIDRPGPKAAWFRLALPLIEGMTNTPLMSACAAADFANGLSWIVPFTDYRFTNADLCVSLSRPPVGEWIGVDAQTLAGDTGSGLSVCVLHDQQGVVGVAQQTLVFQAA